MWNDGKTTGEAKGSEGTQPQQRRRSVCRGLRAWFSRERDGHLLCLWPFLLLRRARLLVHLPTPWTCSLLFGEETEEKTRSKCNPKTKLQRIKSTTQLNSTQRIVRNQFLIRVVVIEESKEVLVEELGKKRIGKHRNTFGYLTTPCFNLLLLLLLLVYHPAIWRFIDILLFSKKKIPTTKFY